MYAIEDFLSNIQSYDSTYDKERFMEELQKVPNYQKSLTHQLKETKNGLLQLSKREMKKACTFFIFYHTWRCLRVKRNRLSLV